MIWDFPWKWDLVFNSRWLKCFDYVLEIFFAINFNFHFQMTSLKFSVVPHSLPEMFKQSDSKKNIYLPLYSFLRRQACFY
jgi:hypothetical protein